MKKLNQKGIGHVLLYGLIAVIVLLIGVIGWFVYDKSKDDETEQKETTTQQETVAEENSTVSPFVAPDGYVEYKDEDNSISFYYPSSWDAWEFGGFQVTKTPNGESFLAPYGGGGGGTRHIFNSDKNAWYRINEESTQFEESKQNANLTLTESDQTEFPVGYAQTGEGGGISHYILITDGTNSFQIVFPGISEENDVDPSGKLQEQKDALSTIIDSIRFL